jgi:hypothetical protein
MILTRFGSNFNDVLRSRACNIKLPMVVRNVWEASNSVSLRIVSPFCLAESVQNLSHKSWIIRKLVPFVSQLESLYHGVQSYQPPDQLMRETRKKRCW